MKKPFYKVLYFQVLFAIVCGILLGAFIPPLGVKMKPFGDGFIKLIKMIIAPVIFCTVASGIAGMQDTKRVGKVFFKALVYFEIVSTFALVIGLIVANVVRPGDGFNANVAMLDTRSIIGFTEQAKAHGVADFILNIIPSTMVGAFAQGDILQVLLLAVLFGIALSNSGESGRIVTAFINDISKPIFGIVNSITKAAPIGAFGAMAFTIGKYGVKSLLPIVKLMGSFYLTAVLFVVIVLGGIARISGFSILRFIYYIREELLIVLGTSSSESALPLLIEKVEQLGCHRSVVGLVVPAGYSFNLDGTNIYMTMATLFIAQAMNVELTLSQQLAILVVTMLTSKGASGVTGAGFITLAATLSLIPTIPVAGMVLILGVDRFMSECRSLTNFIGNGVAALVISRWENAIDNQKLNDWDKIRTL